MLFHVILHYLRDINMGEVCGSNLYHSCPSGDFGNSVHCYTANLTAPNIASNFSKMVGVAG